MRGFSFPLIISDFRFIVVFPVEIFTPEELDQAPDKQPERATAKEVQEVAQRWSIVI